ncbi:MAG: DUF5660 family protein [Candidatus Levyibacteriota bacterium]
MSKKQKSQQVNFLNQNPLESLGNIMQGAGDSFVKDLAGAGASGFFEQMLGIEAKKPEKSSGDLQEGEALDLKKLKNAQIEPGIDYRREIIHADKASSSEDRAIRVRVEEILVEIKKLTQSSKELEMEFRDVAVETQIVKPGKYHESLFEWLYSMVKAARMRIDESKGWLSAMHSKKDRKYWAMFKKHGTTFGLSNERVVATQTG